MAIRKELGPLPQDSGRAAGVCETLWSDRAGLDKTWRRDYFIVAEGPRSKMAVTRLATAAQAQKGDAVLIVAGKAKTVAASLGALRNEVARREKLISQNVYAPLWVTEFPMFEYHEDDDRYYAMHHPFTSPVDDDRTCSNARSMAARLLCWPNSHEGVRPGHQRRRAGEWFDSYSPARRAAPRVQGPGHDY